MPKRPRSRSLTQSKPEKVHNPEDDLLPEDVEEISTKEEEQEGSAEEEIEDETDHGPRRPPKFVPYVDPDSDEDIKEDENTVGEVPMHWYDEFDHIGYNIAGKPIARPERKDEIDSFLDREDKLHWRKVWDEKNQREVVLSDKEMKILRNIQKGRFPEAGYNPYQPFPEIPRPDLAIHPLLNTPEPKSRFVPSKWEAKKIAYLVKAIRKGWIKLDQNEEPENPYYMLWDDENQNNELNKRLNTHIPPPVAQLPGHNESYNPPEEYLLNEEEKKAWELLDPSDRPFNFIPKQFSRLRRVPVYLHHNFHNCT